MGSVTVAILFSGPALAAGASLNAPAESAADAAPESIEPLLGPIGNWGGLRDPLAKQGIHFGIYIGEVWQNTSGGLGAGGRFNGRVQFTFDVDFDKLVHWNGLTGHVSAIQIQGSDFSRIFLDSIIGVSNVDAESTFRLFEAYLEQIFAGGEGSVRVGQLSADSEFAVSDNGSLFLNPTFGWPALFATDLPSGGPAYPLATPGIRVKVQPLDNLTATVGFFNGNPAPCRGDPQVENKNGVNFLMNEGLFIIGEAAVTYGADGPDSRWLPGTIKLGGWYNSNDVSDLRYDTFGLPRASPESIGTARMIEGNYGIYGIVDQIVYHNPGAKDQGVGVFLRASGAPYDRNTLSFYVDGGVNFKSMTPYRPDDSFGVALGYARLSSAARNSDRDAGFYSGAYYPVRSNEMVLEATYSAKIVSGWTLQPDFQYIWRPGGGVLDTTGLRTVRNAAVFGLRTTINF